MEGLARLANARAGLPAAQQMSLPLFPTFGKDERPQKETRQSSGSYTTRAQHDCGKLVLSCDSSSQGNLLHHDKSSFSDGPPWFHRFRSFRPVETKARAWKSAHLLSGYGTFVERWICRTPRYVMRIVQLKHRDLLGKGGPTKDGRIAPFHHSQIGIQ